MNTDKTDIILAITYLAGFVFAFLCGRFTGWIKGFEEGCDLWKSAYYKLKDIGDENYKSLWQYIDNIKNKNGND